MIWFFGYHFFRSVFRGSLITNIPISNGFDSKEFFFFFKHVLALIGTFIFKNACVWLFSEAVLYGFCGVDDLRGLAGRAARYTLFAVGIAALFNPG